MLTDELTTIEGYIRELEALRNYPEVKAERDSLAAENTKLKEIVAELTAQVTSATYIQRKASSQLKKRESEVRELSRKLEKAATELSSLKDLQAKLPGGNGLTLEKMQEQFLSAQAKEIETKVNQRVKELTKKIHSQVPVLVEKEFAKTLKSSNWPPEIQKAVSVEAQRIADEALRDKQKWPEWFKDYFVEQLEEAVDKELDVEFENRVMTEATSRLEAMKTHHWEQFSGSKASQLSVSLRGMVNQLQGTWQFTCDRCRGRIALVIGPSEIGQLLGGGTVTTTCSSCSDPAPPPFILSVVPHKVVITFGDLLRGYLGGSPPPI